MTTTEPAPRPHPGGAGYPAAMREQAAAMRHDGMGRASIARELGVGFATVTRWFREDGISAPTHDGDDGRGVEGVHRRVITERWAHQKAEQDAHRDAVGPISQRELLLVGAALYWAEGAKAEPWRRAHVVSFMNSDPTVIRLFLAYLEVLDVPRTAVRCRLSIHETADVEAAQAFWRVVVGDDVQLSRPHLKRHEVVPERHNTGEAHRGCLNVRLVQGAATYRQIVGTWEGVAAAVGDGSRSPVV